MYTCSCLRRAMLLLTLLNKNYNILNKIRSQYNNTVKVCLLVSGRTVVAKNSDYAP